MRFTWLGKQVQLSGYFVALTGFPAFARKRSKSLRLNSRYPFAGFRCIGMSPRAAHLRSVF